jgi:lipopolysaccharide transport system ATP-binding protein
MMAREIVVSAQNLGKAYRLRNPADNRIRHLLFETRNRRASEFWALKDITFELRKGRALGVIGENGAGKSTLLHLLCGTLRPTTGDMMVAGRVAALLELGTAFNPMFTGRENVWLSATVLGLTRVEIQARFDAIADFAGIGEFMDLPVKLYSSGMKARLAFAVNAHVDADVLIVDEVLAVGDAAFARKCLGYLDRYRTRGTLLFVSHNTGMVAQLCDEALWLDHGTTRELGPANQVCMNYLTFLAEKSEAKDSGAHVSPTGRWQVAPPPPLIKDARSSRRNRIEVSPFNSDAPWHGHGGAIIENAYFCDVDGKPLSCLAGGEEVELRIACRAHREISAPIVGFMLRDRLGQNVFGDSTYLAYRYSRPCVGAGRSFSAGFRFQLPYLAHGDFALTVAITEGTQDRHTHVHWMEEAIILTVRESPVRRGIFGVPLRSMRLEERDSAP